MDRAGVTRGAPFYTADSVTKSFGGRQVLKSASVWGWRGAITVMLGRNGSGKSTLMRIGAGVLRADSGTVHMGGRTYQRPRLHELARAGLYFHPERGCLPIYGSLHDHLDAIIARFGGRYDEAIDLTGMAELIDVPLIELSGGELHRAEVASCIARAPSCLIADEPYAGVSPIDAERLTLALNHLRARGCAIITSGHDVPALMAVADEVVWVTSGTTHALGGPAEAADHHQFATEYLGPSLRYSARPHSPVF
ncbi:MAG TPA: ATP-binding cassette domain-containing protein [Longimicrobiales bacterium]